MQPIHRQYLAQHPLFSRLSGEVIWLLFEEHDADARDIGAFMDQFVPMLVDQAEVLRQLKEHPDGWLRIVPSGHGRPCPGCAERIGRYISASDPRLMDFIPPYSLGCRTLGEFLTAEEFAALDNPTVLPQNAPIPARHLHCPSEWLFGHKWAPRAADGEEADDDALPVDSSPLGPEDLAGFDLSGIDLDGAGAIEEPEPADDNKGPAPADKSR